MTDTRLARAGDWVSRAGSLQPSDPLLRRGLYVGIALVVLLGIALAISASLHELPEIDWRWRPLSLLLGSLGVLAFLLANAEMWRRLLRALGFEIGLTSSTAIWIVSSLARLVPTSLLTPVLRMAMMERERVPKRITLIALVYEVALSVTGGLLVAAYFIIDLPDLQGHWQRFLVLAIPVCALICLQPRIFHRCTDYALHRFGRDPLPLSLRPGRVLEFIALYSLVYILAGLSTYAIAQSVYPIGAGDLPTVIGAFAVGTTFGIFAFVLPGGLVAREAGLAIALSPIMPTAPAIAIAVLTRVVQISIEVILASTMQLWVRRTSYSEDAASEPVA